MTQLYRMKSIRMMNSATISEVPQTQPLVEEKIVVLARELLSLVKMAAMIAVPLLLLSLAWV